MASSTADNVEVIRKATYGIETREPIAECLEETNNRQFVKEFSDDAKGVITTLKNNDLNTVLPALDREMAAKEPRIAAMEAQHARRVTEYLNTEMRQEIEWIEKITHIIHDPPTMYTMIGNSSISATVISGEDYKANDAGSSAAVIDGDDYKMTAGSNWSKESIDDPTHEEYEYITHYVPDYRLTFKRSNEN